MDNVQQETKRVFIGTNCNISLLGSDGKEWVKVGGLVSHQPPSSQQADAQCFHVTRNGFDKRFEATEGTLLSNLVASCSIQFTLRQLPAEQWMLKNFYYKGFTAPRGKMFRSFNRKPAKARPCSTKARY
ncbi:hypothetical protein [Shewanella sp. SM74]|uniref:hypothetical protein n=1 Tax=Shewanella sp. SM74 TaxID=2912807 RepID=UPI0021D8D0A7|nr:hypothetical protein [Shewanella sp. SM74]MCU8012202.1 hypothetical protein [Shewanella sp. SM74]